MAKLLVKTEGVGLQALVLRLGVNRVGRDPECEFCLEHPTISSLHCELALSNDGVYVRDCQSTNGTFVNGAPILEAWLDSGQNLRSGRRGIVSSNPLKRTLPSQNMNVLARFCRHRWFGPMASFPAGGIAESAATFRCPSCKELMCNACIHVLRRRGGPPHFLCIICSQECDPIRAEQTEKEKGILRPVAGHGETEVQAPVRRRGKIARLAAGRSKPLDHFFQRHQPLRMLVQARDQSQIFAARFKKRFASADADFFNRLQAVRDERRADDQQLLDAARGKFLDLKI